MQSPLTVHQDPPGLQVHEREKRFVLSCRISRCPVMWQERNTTVVGSRTEPQPCPASAPRSPVQRPLLQPTAPPEASSDSLPAYVSLGQPSPAAPVPAGRGDPALVIDRTGSQAFVTQRTRSPVPCTSQVHVVGMSAASGHSVGRVSTSLSKGTNGAPSALTPGRSRSFWF